MEVPHQLSEQDFVEAYSLHRKRTTLSKWIVRIMFVWVAVMAAAVYGGAIADARQRTWSNLLPISLLLIFWFLLLRVYPRWNMRRQFRKQPGVQGPRVVTFDADGAHWRWDGGSSDIAWKNYVRWVEGKHQILFYTSPACFNILPTREVQPAQLVDLREMLKQNVSAK